MLNLYLEAHKCSPDIQDALQEEDLNLPNEKEIIEEKITKPISQKFVFSKNSLIIIYIRFVSF